MFHFLQCLLVWDVNYKSKQSSQGSCIKLYKRGIPLRSYYFRYLNYLIGGEKPQDVYLTIYPVRR